MAKKSKKPKKPGAHHPKAQSTIALQRVARPISAAAPTAVDPSVPVATINSNGGPVTVAITFGQAQHAKYTIQLFDPAGVTEMTRETGLNTDSIPDQFTLQGSPAQLNQHIVQWSGLISAFSPSPGQQFSIIFDVTQGGLGVPGGRVHRTGPLSGAQVFVGVLRLVTI
jgi:hypothetical protein